MRLFVIVSVMTRLEMTLLSIGMRTVANSVPIVSFWECRILKATMKVMRSSRAMGVSKGCRYGR